MPDYSENTAYIWLSLLGRPVNVIASKLLYTYGDIKNIWDINNVYDLTEEIADKEGLASRILDRELKDKAQKYYEKTLKAGAFVTHIDSCEYPLDLKRIYDPPIVLYYYGSLPKNDCSLLSVVGSRKCTEYGRKVTYDLCGKLVEYGVGIVSGMAKGIDARAHAGALDAKGYTIAVLGGGPDNIYPPENEVLYYRIRENGCIISEYIPGTMPLKQHFPARNRIIAGLGAGTLVCEAGIKSGAMITVNYAISEGRDIFSVPGNINSLYSEGCNRLIKAGANIAIDEKEILEVLGLKDKEKIAGKPGWLNGLDREESRVVSAVYDGINTTEELYEKLDIEWNSLLATISILEIKGILQKSMSGELDISI